MTITTSLIESKLAPSKEIAQAMVDVVMGKFDALQAALRNPGEMNIVQAIAHARRGAFRLRSVVTESTQWHKAQLIAEETAAIEQLCKLVEANLLKPEPSRKIATAIMGKFDRLQEALRRPGEHMAEAGKRGVKS